MTDQPISLASAKQAAKHLRRALQAADPAAAERFAAVFAGRRDPATATHADCLHVIAREAGAESWPRLKLAVETAAMTRGERIDRLRRAVANGAFHVADRLTALDATLVDADFGLQLAFARPAALARLAKDPTLAITPRDDRWPIHDLCYSKIHLQDPAGREAQIALLDALVAAGADVNQGFPAEPGANHLLSPLYGALGHAGNLPLAEALLRHGADPNDNESLYHATELSTLDGVRLLFAHGAEIGHTNAFYRMLDRESLDGVHLFLDHGADPNDPVYRHPAPEPQDERNALHHAIFRGRSGAIGALLIDRGADVTATYDGHTPYALALACGNTSMAEMLTTRGHATPLSDTEQFLAAVARADTAAAQAVLADTPDLMADLSDKDRRRQTDLAMHRNSLPVLRSMAAAGFDPNLPGESGMPPVHAAAWWGHADIVDMYVGLGVDLETVNEFGGTALGTAVHGSANCPGRDTGDYLRVVQSLVDAGARINPRVGHLDIGSAEVVAYLEDRLEGAS